MQGCSGIFVVAFEQINAGWDCAPVNMIFCILFLPLLSLFCS